MSDTGVPKNFMIRCHSCRWAESSSGVSQDLTHLHEIQNNCADCGKARRFVCPKCGGTAYMKRIRGNT